MRGAFAGLMNQFTNGGGGAGDGLAQPVHHILEEKVDPRTGKRSVVGTDWRRRALDFYKRQDADAGNPDLSTAGRQGARQRASDILTDVGDEDFIHMKLQEGLSQDDAIRELAHLKAERGDIRSGYQAGFGLSNEEAAKKGYKPPKPQGF